MFAFEVSKFTSRGGGPKFSESDRKMWKVKIGGHKSNTQSGRFFKTQHAILTQMLVFTFMTYIAASVAFLNHFSSLARSRMLTKTWGENSSRIGVRVETIEAVAVNISESLATNTIKGELIKGTSEGLFTEIVSMMKIGDHGIDCFHHTIHAIEHDIMSLAWMTMFSEIVKNFGVDTDQPNRNSISSTMLQNSTEDFSPIPHISHSLESKSKTKNLTKHEKAVIRVAMLLFRCILFPLLMHSLAHTVPASVIHFATEEFRQALDYFSQGHLYTVRFFTWRFSRHDGEWYLAIESFSFPGGISSFDYSQVESTHFWHQSGKSMEILTIHIWMEEPSSKSTITSFWPARCDFGNEQSPTPRNFSLQFFSFNLGMSQFAKSYFFLLLSIKPTSLWIILWNTNRSLTKY